jgi:tetratricopeptide (TPR) repeat protein
MDPFDQALGVCDSCRSRAEDPMQGGQVAGLPNIEPPPSSLSSGPSSAEPAESRPAPRAPPRPYTPPAPAMTARSAQRSTGKGALIGGIAAAVLLLGGGGGGAYYYFVVHKQATQQVVATPEAPPAPPPLPEAVQAALSRWQLKYLEITDTSAELVAQGNEQLKKDQRVAYTEAEDYFQQALLQDPRNDTAIGGYVLALALGRAGGMDEPTFQEALALIEAAENRSGRASSLLLAHANLLLARPNQPQNVEKAKQLADLIKDLGSDAEKAEANLVLGRAFLSTSMGLANQHFDSALELAPGLQRVHYYRALAYEKAGEYTQALEALKKRMAQDPQHWDGLAATGRIYQELGEVKQVRELYEARLKAQPKDLRARLALAALQYQSEDNVAGALKELRAILKNRANYANRDVAEALVHLAITERLANNPDAAVKAAEEALALEKGHVAAHLQLFLLALGREDAAKAGKHLTAVKGQLEDPALEKVLEGRLLMLEGKSGEAVARFQEAFSLDNRRHDALLLAGVASAKDKQRNEAFRYLFQALAADPLRLAPRSLASLLYVRPTDTLKGTEGVIVTLASSQEDVVPRLYEGLLRYHQGELVAAEKLFKQVIEVDEDNSGAIAYLSLISLQRGNKAAARSFGAQAVAAGRQDPVAHFVHGLALAEAKQVEPAKRALREALLKGPKLLAAEVKLAELEAARDKDSARARLVKVVGLDPAYHPAKRALFLLERKG